LCLSWFGVGNKKLYSTFFRNPPPSWTPEHSHMHVYASLLVKLLGLKEHTPNISFQRVLKEENCCADFGQARPFFKIKCDTLADSSFRVGVNVQAWCHNLSSVCEFFFFPFFLFSFVSLPKQSVFIVFICIKNLKKKRCLWIYFY